MSLAEQLYINIYAESDKIIDYIQIVCNGMLYKTIDSGEKIVNKRIEIPPFSKKRYFYLRVKLRGKDVKFEHNLALAEGNYIYSSPIWVFPYK